MAIDKLVRFQRLVALAGSPNEHEARSAAVQAVKMLGEGGSIVALAKEDPRCELPALRPGEPGWEETAWGRVVEREVMLRFERMRVAWLASQPPPHPKPNEPGWESSLGGRWAIAEVGRLLKSQTEVLRRAGRVSPEILAAGAGRPARPRHMPGWMKIAANSYGGPCQGTCGQIIAKGAPIYWRRGSGIMCIACCEAG